MKYEELKTLYRAGRIGRREFMAGAAAIGALTAASSLLGAKAFAAEPKKGGALKMGIGAGSTTDSMDPATILDTYMQTVSFGCLRNNLTEVDNTGKLVGELAEGWDSDDAATWVFKLRSGVEFHNGKTMTADDVIASINHHRGPDTKSPGKALLATLTEVRKDDDSTVVFVMTEPNADFPYILSDYHLPILPATDSGIDWESGVGTGGYLVKEFEPGVRTYMERNPNYWKQGRAHFDSVEVLAIIDVAARQNALTTGEINLMDRCDLKTVNLLERAPNIDVFEVTGSQHYTFAMRTDMAPFDNNDVRLALKLAIKREELVQTILRGHGVVGNDTPMSAATSFYVELEQRTYDPDKAKFHLKQAGLDSLSVDLSAADAAFAGAVDAAVLYKEHAAAAGIDINVVREPNDGYWSNVWMKKPYCAVYWSGRPTADWMFSTAYAADAAWNDTFWKHERFNELLIQGRAELDEAKRSEIYREMQQILRDEGGVVVPMFANYVNAATKGLAHDTIGANWDLDGLKLPERWWFA